MNRRFALLGLVAVALLAVALYVLGGDRERGPSSEGVSKGHGGEDARVQGGGGIVGAGSDRDGSATVRGEVIDEDGLPVTEGAVTLRCLRGDRVSALGSVALDEEGTFEAAGCRGQVCAALQHPTQRPKDAWVLSPGAHAKLVTQTLPRLWGVVNDASGQAVEAARVIFRPGGDPQERDRLALLPLAARSTTTDADGRFVVAWIERPPCGPCEDVRGGCQDLPPFVDTIRATASAAGFASVHLEWDIDEAVGEDPDDPLVLTLPNAGDLLTGHLVDANGLTYPRAYILANPLARPSELRRANVDDEGDFELDGLSEGPHRVRALQDGVELASGQGEAGEDVSLTGTPDARGTAVEVLVVDAQGSPLPAAAVDGGPFRKAKTDARGQVRASRVLAGPVTLLVRKGGQAVREPIDVPEALPEDPAQTHRVRVQLVPDDGSADG